MSKKFFIAICILLLLPIPVFGGFEDVEDSIAGGLNKWVKSMADSMMGPEFGVTTGNLSAENVTPSQRLIYNLDTYQTDPYSVGWIKQTVKDDYVTYVLVGMLILIILACLYYLQILDAPFIGKATEFIYGNERYFDYHRYLTTFAKLILFPTVLPFVLIYSINFEQAFSSGIMKDALPYISFSSDNIPLYVIQAIAYAFDSLFVLARIIIINEVCAKVLLVAILLCMPFNTLKWIGKGILVYFYTALFMRPALLLITTLAIKDVAGMSPTDSIIFGADIYAVSLILGFIVCIIGTLGPIIYIIWKTTFGYYVRRGYRRVSRD
jgi:hypothetical protein